MKRKCPHCNSELVLAPEVSGLWGNFFKCLVHGIVSGVHIVYE